MAPARGDRRRCTHADCSGTMQFGRQVRLQTHSATTLDGERGWVCSENPRHFELATDSPRQMAATSAAPQARWADDGGSSSTSAVP
jgi:hypothetical protein